MTHTDTPSDRLLSVQDVADRLGVAPTTVYRLIAEDAFPICNLSTAGSKRARTRVKESALNAYIASL